VSITSLPAFEAAVVTAVRALLDAVPGVDHVYDGEPHAPDWPTFLDAFRLEDGTIRGWIVFPDVEETRSGARENHVAVRVVIRGFRSVELAKGTRAEFRATVLGVVDAFRNSNLNGTVEFTDPMTTRLRGQELAGQLVEDRMLGDVLCHVAELELVGHEWLTY
jgi:hypothetical protein